jgi:response regulator RpfG family c-di-GMP phosphodiesterase
MEKMTIICIDDENVVLRSLKNELIYMFSGTYSVEVAESGQEALDILQELTAEGIEVPVVICDYIMPGMKGDEVLGKIHAAYPDIITVMLTGRAVTQGVINAVNNACLFRYVEKPWTGEILKAAVIGAVDLYNSNRKLKSERENLLNIKKQLKSEALSKKNQLLKLKERLDNEKITSDLNSFYRNLKLINEIKSSISVRKSDLLVNSQGLNHEKQEKELETLLSHLPDSEKIDRILSDIERLKTGTFPDEGLIGLQDMNLCIAEIVEQIGQILGKDYFE